MRAAIAAFVLIAIACGPTGGVRSAGTATPTVAVTVPSVNVDDMMGGSFSPATVLALAGNEILGVKLQNHHTAYRIAVGGRPHAVASPDGSRFYLADRKDDRVRVRAFDAASGTELSSLSLGNEPLAEDVALAQDRQDRLLLLVRAGEGFRVDAIKAMPSLTAPAVGMFKSPCGERILASATRLAIVCGAGDTARISLAELRGDAPAQGGGILTIPERITSSAMLVDGTIVLGASSGKLHLIRDVAAVVPGPENIGGTPIAVAPASADRAVVFLRSETGSAVVMYDPRSNALSSGRFAIRGRFGHGVAAWPFAYFSGSEPGLWHVDLRTGNVERMTVLPGMLPLAVAGR